MTELAPWLRGGSSDEGTPPKQSASSDSNLAPWLREPEIGTAEDMAKTAPASAVRAAIGAVTPGGTLTDLMGRGGQWLIDKVAPDSKAAGAVRFLREIDTDPKTGKSLTDQKSFFPSYGTVQDKVEKVTGPLHDPETIGGKALGAGIETGPAVLGGSVLGTLGKMVGAGVGSGALGEAAKAAGDFLPSWGEPVARAVGAMVGTGLPAAARRVATPLPMSNERLATVNALKATNPELVDAATAGQLTQSPRAMALEGRSPRLADVPEKQAEAYTQGVMRQAGSTGMFDTAGKLEAKNVGKELELLRDAHSVSPAEMTALKTKLKNDYVTLSTHAGRDAAKPLLDFAENIRLGPDRGTPNFPTNLGNPLHPTDIPGKRVADLLQTSTKASPSSVQQALITARKDLLDAFHNSMPAAEAAKHADLSQKYSNYKTIEKIKTDAGQNTLTPNQVFKKAPETSDLKAQATQAASVMQPLPKPAPPPAWFDFANSAATSLAHGLTGAHVGGGMGALTGAGEGWVTGHLAHPSIWNMSAEAMSRALSSKKGQEYLKNQKWRPDANTSAPDKETLLRLLMTPPQTQALPGGSR